MRALRLLLLLLTVGATAACDSIDITAPICDPTTMGSGVC